MSKQGVFICLCGVYPIKIAFKSSQKIETHPINLALVEHEVTRF